MDVENQKIKMCGFFEFKFRKILIEYYEHTMDECIERKIYFNIKMG